MPGGATLAPDPALPADTRLWAALQELSGGCWGAGVFDPEAMVRVVEAGRRAVEGRASRG